MLSVSFGLECTKSPLIMRQFDALKAQLSKEILTMQSLKEAFDYVILLSRNDELNISISKYLKFVFQLLSRFSRRWWNVKSREISREFGMYLISRQETQLEESDIVLRCSVNAMAVFSPCFVDSRFDSPLYSVEKLALRHVVDGAAKSPACYSEKTSQSKHHYVSRHCCETKMAYIVTWTQTQRKSRKTDRSMCGCRETFKTTAIRQWKMSKSSAMATFLS